MTAILTPPDAESALVASPASTAAPVATDGVRSSAVPERVGPPALLIEHVTKRFVTGRQVPAR